jgi:serine/threonine-protein kinase
VASQPTSLSEREERFGEIAFAYLRAREEGHRPDSREWLARYPEFGAELASFIADQEAVERLGAPLRDVARVAERPSTEGPAATARPDDAAGPGHLPDSFGDYDVLEQMARGGMGTVYRARQRSLNRLVALKVVRAGDLASAEEVRRFRNEAETVALLDHPHIVPVHDVGEEAGQLYFSMKLVEGGSLAQHLGRFRDDPRSAAALMATVARAVHHAHQRGVLHRDLKPSNILLEEDGRPHVTDFGLARRVEADSSLTQSGAIVGTPSYMAPEQATGQKGAVTTATDVYGLGAVLYALLTGRPPFQAENVLETLMQVRERQPQLPSGLNRRTPRDLETICLKCLTKEPARRYGSALGLADDLERFLVGQPIQARPVGVWERGAKWARRRPLAVTALAGLVAALVLLGAGVGWVLGDRSARQREAEGKVREELDAAGPGLKEGNPWDRALVSAVVGASAQLGGGLLSHDSRQQVEQLQKDVHMLAELERIRLEQSAVRNGQFDQPGSDSQYARAFQEYGIDMDRLGPEEVAALVQRSAIREHIVAGLDDWAHTLSCLPKEEAHTKAEELLAVARQADPDWWRNRWRATMLSPDTSEREQLVGSAPVKELNAATLALLGRPTDQPQGVRNLAPMVEFLRHAQRRFPADFWINQHLASALAQAQPQRLEEAIGHFRVAVALRPLSPGAHTNLGVALYKKGDLDGAIAEFHEAIRLKQDYGEVHINLGAALRDNGDVDGAIAEYKEALRLKAYPEAHNNLGNALHAKGDLDGATAEYKEALRLRNDFDKPHCGLGNVLYAKGELDGAVAEYKEALRLNKEDAMNHSNLSIALRDKGDLDGAIAECRQALRLKENYAQAHNNLAIALQRKGDVDGAISESREAVRLKKEYAPAHLTLAIALQSKGDVDGAIFEYREALRLNKNHPEANCNLGHALCDKGQFSEALAYLRRGHELGSMKPRWPYPSAQWVQHCERLVELDAKLPQVLKGDVQPADVGERLALAQMCQQHRSLNTAAVRFYTDAFTEQPRLADDLQGHHRYNAASAAALAGCGQGKDVEQTDGKERIRLRARSLEWLRADLAAYRKLLEKVPDRAAPLVRERMQRWQKDTDFAGVRGAEALAKLPEAERHDWQKLWADVTDLLTRAGGKAGPEKKSSPK